MAISPKEAELLWTLWRSEDYHDVYRSIVNYGELLDAREEALMDLDEFIEEHTGESLGWSLSFIFAYLFNEGVGSWSGEIDFDSAMSSLGFHPTSHSYRHFRELTENLITMLEANDAIENELVKLQASYLKFDEEIEEAEVSFLDDIAARWNNLEMYIARSDERYADYPSIALKTRFSTGINRLDKLFFGKRDLDRDEVASVIITSADEREAGESRWDHPSLETVEEVMTYLTDRESPGRTPQRQF